MMWNNDKLFKSDFLPNNMPESLFLQVEQCQEVAIIACSPYSDTQLITNTMHLLLQSGPIWDLPNEGVQGLGSDNQLDVDVTKGIHSRCFQALSCGGRHLLNIGKAWLRSRKQLHDGSKQIC
jgi:hypothetical protein